MSNSIGSNKIGGSQIGELPLSGGSTNTGKTTAANLLPKGAGWVNQMTAGITNGSATMNPATPDIVISVPVKPGDSHWDVVRSSLPILAKQAGLSQESQKVFAEKWATKLEDAGETSIYQNKDGDAVGVDGFSQNINRKNAAAGNVGTYELTFTSRKHADMLADLQQLRRNDVLTSQISDPKVRQETRLSLNQLVVGDGADKLNAAQKLQQLAQPGQPDADKVYQTVKALAANPEMQLNAAVKMTELQLDLDKYNRTFGPRDENVFNDSIRNRANEIVQLVEKDDLVENITLADGKADRAEAAWVNQDAGRIFEQIGDKKEARYREMLGRFYEVDKDERPKYESGMFGAIERWKNTGGDSMRATLPEETALRRFEEVNGKPEYPTKELGEDPQKREYKGKNKYIMNDKGELVKSPETIFQREGSMKVEGKEIGVETHLDERGRKVDLNKPYDRKQTSSKNIDFESTELNQRGTVRAVGISGAVGLIDEINKWGTFLGDFYNETSAKKYQERVRLEKAETQATHFPVPPKPEDLPKFKQQFETYFSKQKADVMINKLSEMSHAFYGR